MPHLWAIDGGGEDFDRLEEVAAIAETQIIPEARGLLDCAAEHDVESVKGYLRDLELATAAVRELIGPHVEPPA